MSKIIELTQGKFSIVSDSDYESLSQCKWYARHSKGGKYYACRCVGRTTIRMHRVVMGDPPFGVQVDHINGNSLDNRRCNLRLCGNLNNCHNKVKTSKSTTSIYKGVCLDKNRNKWVSKITFDYKREFLGYFDDEEDAALAYDERASKLFGEFAVLNFSGGIV